MIQTKYGTVINDMAIHNYFHSLISKFFKILPMRENNETTISVYAHSLMNELAGCNSLIPELNDDAIFMSLLFTLQYLADNANNDSVKDVKREVFKAISNCNKLEDRYSPAGCNDKEA